MATTHPWDHMVHDMREEMHDLANLPDMTADRQAFLAMWATFVALPLIFGIDKLSHFMTNTWDGYVAVWANNFLPGTAHQAVIGVGIVEIVLAVVVLLAPHAGGDLLGLLYVLLAINLFGVSDMHHLAIGMLALAFCSFAMGRMARGDHRREA
ncbi:hypothetical protein [Nocardioides ultimimeridianus]